MMRCCAPINDIQPRKPLKVVILSYYNDHSDTEVTHRIDSVEADIIDESNKLCLANQKSASYAEYATTESCRWFAIVGRLLQ